MQIIVNTENRESVYEVVYDENVLRDLINNLINDCSIRVRCRSRVQARYVNDAINKIDSTKDFCGNKIYENVSDIREEPVYDPCDYWRHGDPVPYSFSSDRLFSPELVNFLVNIINEKQVDFDWFTNRTELFKRAKLEDEIKKIDSEINEISNFDTKKKISKLEELERKVNQLENMPAFNYDLLAKYYDMAQNCIKLELVQETIKYQRKLK